MNLDIANNFSQSTKTRSKICYDFCLKKQKDDDY